MRNQLSQLAYNLCEIPSLSFAEQQVLEYIKSWLTQAGLSYDIIPVTNSSRYNILAYYNSPNSSNINKQQRFNLILCTHLDTVGPYIAPSLEQNILWGRGACDAKGIAACMLTALLESKKLGFEDLAVLLTVGEEESSDGAKACRLKNRARYLLVGEPTELRAASGQKGSLVFDVKAYGQESHSSMPELGNSAINNLVNILYRLSHKAWPIDNTFGTTLFNAGVISGGSKRNVLASYAQAQCIMRLAKPAAYIIDMVQAELSELADQAAAPGQAAFNNIAGMAGTVELNILSSADPFSYMVPSGFPSFVAGFGTDAPYLADIGPTILLGPGSLSLAHQPNEHILLSDLEAGFEAYMKIAAWARAQNDV